MRRLALPPSLKFHKHFWVLMVAGLAVTTVLPIGIHTVMLDDLGVPYPSAFPRNGWASVPDHALLILGAIALNGRLAEAPAKMSGAARGMFLFLVLAAINQTLFRLPIMRNAVSTKWTIYPFIDNAPAILQFAAIAILVGAIGPFLTTITRRIVAAIAIAVIAFAGVRPLLDRVFAPIVAGNSTREGNQLYTIPYDWHVDVPSYLTYIEPVIGGFAVAMILTRFRVRWPVIAVIVFALQGGPLFRLVLNPFYASTGPWLAVLSEAQFTLEAATLAILVATISTVLLNATPDQGTL